MIPFPTIDPVQTGANIVRLRKAAGLSVHDLQVAFHPGAGETAQ